MCPRWAVERGTATTVVEGWVEVRKGMDMYWECALQSPVTSDLPSVLPLVLLRTFLKSVGVTILWDRRLGDHPGCLTGHETPGARIIVHENG